ncbi:MAG: Unknown protein [uncultured Sulfurovum sp.]|uniref:DUF1302 domain-containing protein n=1 Tax=uncultured Sulfurovum sp. TaxID=269237 RepID=A0A6S6SLT0_9BACT|nr:MAG: Unknown protein [uncultured Sulfurovum sp.]
MFRTSRVGFRRQLISSCLLISTLNAENLDDLLEGFDDAPKQVETLKAVAKETKVEDDLMDGFDDATSSESTLKKTPELVKAKDEKSLGFLSGVTGKLTEQMAFAYGDDAPHDNISSLKSSLLLDYEHKFDNGFRVKTNAKAYYDAIYGIRGRDKYSKDELDELESEVELFDAYVEGSLTDNLDMKLGRQVVVWGRSDTIRITDVLNPLDNRRPGMVDIEDLRLPVAMAKFDYFVGDWRVTPMAVLEQRFSKNPAAGSAFNPSPNAIDHNDYSDVTPALSIGAEFSGWDVNFYAANTRDDAGYFSNGKLQHDKTKMFGAAVNVLSGSWLLKGELAHFDGLKYTNIKDKEFKRIDGLVGVEYNGISDTLISYDASVRKLNDYDTRLKNLAVEVKEETYQHAFRVSSDFMNATLKGNYLLSLFGSKFDEGGFQRAWVKYDISDGIFANVGVVDYIGGSERFDAVSNNDMVFLDVSYSF